MQRYAILVDAGYLFAQAAHIVSSGANKKRASLDLYDPVGFIAAIELEARTLLDLGGKELLRIYWYDGVGPTGLTPQQKGINNIPDVQFRSGTINGRGQQKGVDTLLVIDLIELSTNRAISDAVIVASDADFAAGIELAQRRGVRVGVLGIEDQASNLRHSQSPEVLDRADRRGIATSNLITPYCNYKQLAQQQPSASQPQQPTGSPQTQSVTIGQVVEDFITRNAPPEAAIDSATGQIDAETDRKLIYTVYVAIGRALTPDEKKEARQQFKLLLPRR